MTELPLSLSQEHALLRQEFLRRGGMDVRGLYQQRAVFKINAHLDCERLEDALTLLIARHTALRSTIEPRARYSEFHRRAYLSSFARRGIFVPGMFAQRIHAAVKARIRVRTLDSDAANAVEALRKAVLDDESEPLDLAMAPAIRVTVVSGYGLRAMIVATSHITHDAIAGELMLEELGAIYTALLADRPPRLGPARTHIDFVKREHEAFSRGRSRLHEDFWWKCWQDARGAIVGYGGIPFRRSGGTLQSSTSLVCEASAKDSHAIRVAAREARVTLYVLFRAIMALTLSRWSDLRRVAFWANFANRRHPTDSAVVTWCATSHLLVTEIPGAGNLLDLVRGVADSVREAMAHEATPLAAVWLRHGADLARFLDTRINFDAATVEPSDVAPTFEHLHLPGVVPLVDLDVRLSVGEVLLLTARFSGDRYSGDGVEEMLRKMMGLAVQFAGRPDIPIVECSAFLDASRPS